MLTVCFVAVAIGSAIMLASIFKYYRALVRIRKESRSAKTFSRWTYMLCMGLMIFFFVGYVILGVYYFERKELVVADCLTGIIFLLGSVFVYVVITVQGQMSDTICGQADEIVKTLVNAMEAKDQYTRGHSVHVSNIVRIFYQHLPPHLKRQVDLSKLTDAAILHDIGKIGISDVILNKPGPLTEEEMSVLRTHPRMGKEIVSQTSFADLGDIILAHHERVDQKGYYRLNVHEIPIESKIIAIADTFSALYSDRVYRPRKSFEESMRIVKEVAGIQLDAELVEIFLTLSEEDLNAATHNLFSMESKERAARKNQHLRGL